MLGFVVLLLYLGSVLMFMVQVTTWGYRNHVCWSLEDVLSWPCCSLALFFLRSRMGGLVLLWILEQQCWPCSSGENWSSPTPALRKDGSTPQQCLQLSWVKHWSWPCWMLHKWAIPEGMREAELTCHTSVYYVVACVRRERCPSPCYWQQAKELASVLEEWENKSFPSPPAARRKADLVLCLGSAQ